jgi:transposase-like protein
MVTSHDHQGSKSAIAHHFQGASYQRCRVHYARNLLGMVGLGDRKELACSLKSRIVQESSDNNRRR